MLPIVLVLLLVLEGKGRGGLIAKNRAQARKEWQVAGGLTPVP
jgi:hypothetical protein